MHGLIMVNCTVALQLSLKQFTLIDMFYTSEKQNTFEL